MTGNEAIQHCISYILEHEAKDFAENPSKTHIYYSALVARYGNAEADRTLNRIRAEL